MRLLHGPLEYFRRARTLAGHWRRPWPSVLARMIASRLLFDRGPAEFDLQGFTTRSLRRWRDYVVEEERERLQRAASPAQWRWLEEDKMRFWQRCQEAGLPAAPILALLTRGERPSVPDGIRVAATAEELGRLLAPLGTYAGFAKPVSAGEGYGAFGFDLVDGQVLLQGQRGDARLLYDHCAGLAINRHGYLLQPRLQPHSQLAPVNPGPGLGTFRLVTFLGRDGVVEVPWATFKAPAAGAYTCNSRLGATLVTVDMRTGRLGRARGPDPGSGVTTERERHPETGVPFSDVTVPDWAGIVALVTRAATVFRELPCLGWDVAVTPQGPLLVETNWNFGMSVLQATLGRGLHEEFTRQMHRCLPLDRVQA